MPIPTVTCLSCGKTVNKRQTILVDKGRVCRDHQEAKDYQEALDRAKAQEVKAKEDKEKWAEAKQNLDSLMIVEQIRMLAHMKGMDLRLVASLMCANLPAALANKVAQGLDERGPLTEDEFTSAAVMALELKNKGMV